MTKPDDSLQRFHKELLAGTVSLVLLSLLAQVDEPLYGYQIAKRFEVDGSPPPIKRGTLYPALRSLEARGFLSSHIEASDAGPPRRYYRITETGRAAAVAWQEVWHEVTGFVHSILQGDASDERRP